MKLVVSSGKPIQGFIETEIPGDKSISHRAALFSALADGESRIKRFQVSGVTRPMLNALTALGVNWQLQGETLTVSGKGVDRLKNPGSPLECGNSATTLRLLAGAVAGSGVSAVLDGSEGLRRRPMGRIVEPLLRMGVMLTPSAAGTAPLSITGREKNTSLAPLHYDLPVASAQVKSCLLLAALGADGTTVLSEPGPSRDHSERMLASMGVSITTRAIGEQIVIELTPPNPLKLSPLNMTLPADPSAAAFLIVAALITPGSDLTLKGICLNPTRTGLIDALLAMGAQIKVENERTAAGEPVGDLHIISSDLQAAEIHGSLVVRMIDEFPIFAVAAAAAAGTTTVCDAAELRLKESDRISMLAKELRTLGVKIDEQPDGFIIQGGEITGGTVHSHGDHRLAMSLAVAGLIAKSTVEVLESDCTAESFPRFAETMQKLGAALQSEE